MDRLTELRRRLGVTAAQVSDEVLSHFLAVADEGLGGWLVPDAQTLYPDNVDEAAVIVALHHFDTSSRAVASMAPDGSWTLPATAPTPGLVRAGFPALGPALRAGGLSV